MSSEVDKGGRPTDLTPEVVTKLESAFHNGFNVGEACQYSGISKPTFYRWLEAHDWFRDKMDDARGQLNRKAKAVLKEAIEAGDINTVRWYLDRRDPDYKAKGEIDLNHGLKDTRSKIKEFLDDGSDSYQGADTTSPEPLAEDTAGAGDEVAQTPADIS